MNTKMTTEPNDECNLCGHVCPTPSMSRRDQDLDDRTLAITLQRVADTLCPGESPAIKRLCKLADKAASGFPLLIVAQQNGCLDRHGEFREGVFETQVSDNAVEVVDFLAHVQHTHGNVDLSFYRLAAYPRHKDGEVLEFHHASMWDVMSSDESTIVDRRVAAAVQVKSAAAQAKAEAKALRSRGYSLERERATLLARLRELDES